MKAVPVKGDSKASVTCTMYAFSLFSPQNQSEKAQRDARRAPGWSMAWRR